MWKMGIIGRSVVRARVLQAAVLALPFTLVGIAHAQDAPPSFVGTLEPGESVLINKPIPLPADTPRLDFLLLVDLSGSYWDDLPSIKAHASGLYDNIVAQVPDSRFALATFVDFPFTPWGYAPSGDYAYRLDMDFTFDKMSWLSAVNAMRTSSGYDAPESQYEGLFQAITGLGREMPISLDGDYNDLGEIAPGQNATFRADATKVIAITTDAPFHQGGDYGPVFPYPGATQAQTIDALLANNIKIIAIKAPGAGSEMNYVAGATGGAVVYTGSTSAEIAQAILDGLESLLYTVSAAPEAACEPLYFAYEPDSFTGVAGGTTVTFQELIGVPMDITAHDLDADGKIVCHVDFLADDTVIAAQYVEVYVPLNNPPVALCQDLTLVADESCVGFGDINAGSFDPDGDAITLAYSMEPPYEVGDHLVTLTVTDTSGAADTCEAKVSVVDATPPVVVLAEPVVLWPPNHKYVDLSLGDCVLSVTDACNGELDIEAVGTIHSAYSDEPEDAEGNGDGKSWNDIVLSSTTAFALRSERAGGGNGRVYGITYHVSDSAGNVYEEACYVGVPHSDNGGAAVDDGAASGYSVVF